MPLSEAHVWSVSIFIPYTCLSSPWSLVTMEALSKNVQYSDVFTFLTNIHIVKEL